MFDISRFQDYFCDCQKEAHRIATKSGWWETDAGEGPAIANMHAELSEAWEWIRKRNPKSDHIPEFSGVEEEFADVIIRIMDTAEKRGYDISGAIVAKMKFNETRPHRHGGKLF
jgi:NTP pyrophosphatase (non-canonical NTP hydrolase)